MNLLRSPLILAAVLFFAGLRGALAQPETPALAKRPNILWISLEDLSPDLGCYGDRFANTPVFDRFAQQGIRFTRVFTHAPVCAPSRSGIITGMYPTTIGTHHMRCQTVGPPHVKCFTEYLRQGGYYCTNNAKTDYQFAPPITAWDQNGAKAHWRDRAKNQPFFAVFNFTNTHESQIRAPSAETRALVNELQPSERHDPAKAVLPPYYPDTPAVRRDWANYYDNVTAVQKKVRQILDQLRDDGLEEDTIVWIWGDHGRGLPRGKRWVYDSGIHLPLLVRVPEKWRSHVAPRNPQRIRPGAVIDDLIAAIDFGPTVLSLAGVQAPKHVQGRAFLGPQTAAPRDYIVAARDRMDERYDLIRALRDKRYKYIRNFMPHLPYAQHISYMDLMPTMQDMRRLNEQGRLEGPQTLFFRRTKPVEELYDTETDPHEVHSLAADPRYADTLTEMRAKLEAWMRETNDLGLIPEPLLDAAQRPGGATPQVAPPEIYLVRKEGEVAGERGGVSPLIALRCSDDSASIAFKLAGERGSPWNVYSNPLKLTNGTRITVKTCRIGHRDSEPVSYQVGETPPAPAKPANRNGDEDWRLRTSRGVYPRADLLARLLRIKELDHEAGAAMDRYHQSLGDEHPAVRYWALVGLRVATSGSEPPSAIKRDVARLVESDPADVVRVAAARMLCDWGESTKGIPMLIEFLDDRPPSLALHAAQALDELGNAAEGSTTEIRRAAANAPEYVERVSSHLLKRLSAADER